MGNPFQDSLRFGRRLPPCAVVIFGANGDLTKRKLLPALYRLFLDRRLPPGFAVTGISRTPMTDDQFRGRMRDAVMKSEEGPPGDALWSEFAQSLFYFAGDVGDPAMFGRLASHLAEIEQARQTGGNILFYLSLQPSQYATAARGLGAAGLNKGTGWRRLVVEKPFGRDGASARAPQRRPAKCLSGAGDLPHRSLPGQGDGAEHHGLPLRQRHF